MRLLNRHGGTVAITVYSCALIALLFSSMRTIYMALTVSGVVESAADALTFSLIPLGLAFALHSLAGWLSEGARDRYARLLALVAVGLALAWALLFGLTYGGLFSSELPDPMNVAVGAAGYPQALFTVGLAAESCMAAVLMLAIGRVAERHRGVEPNPAKEVCDVAAN